MSVEQVEPRIQWRLCLSDRSLERFPEDQLTSSLLVLELANTKLSSFTLSSSSVLYNLQYLNLSSNSLAFLPDFSLLSSLLSLDVSNNELQCVPEGIHALSLLRRLNMQKNCITEVPDLCQLEPSPHAAGQLRFLFIRDNPFHSLVWASKQSRSAISSSLPQTKQISSTVTETVCAVSETNAIVENADTSTACLSDSRKLVVLRRLSFLEGKIPHGSFPDMILPGLYISNQFAAESEVVLMHLRISHVVRVVPGYWRTKLEGLKVMHIRVLDTQDVKLSPFFKSACEFIDRGREKGNVLVHCQMGISRSAAIVIAYVMYHNKISFKESLSFVRRLHPCRPNSSFMEQLQEWMK